MRCSALFAIVCLCFATLAHAEEPVDFTTQIRPLLSNKCFACHGPDEDERQGGLRLDRAESAFGLLESGVRAIVPRNPAASEILVRMRSTDEAIRMPPAEFGQPLSAQEIELVERWVQEAAPFAEHWSYAPPQRPTVPIAEPTGWCRNEIDHFILARLSQEGLTPGPEADRYSLIRRVSLDLTGLPPSPAEVTMFVNDSSEQAYENLVDRLLAKPSYGEHWARKWLDLARYADSAGYADDPPRTIWAYRDWVIRAYNDNMPFDQFTIEQIAGDLLPEPTDDQLIATAFHRNTLTNNEGGTSDEEFRNVAVVDRVNTTMATWMGTTMACAQCHTHKYDPITQTDYFRLFAILNNTQDADRRDESPLFEIFSPEQRQQQADWEAERKQLEAKLATMTPALKAEMHTWEEQFRAELEWYPLTANAATSRENAAVLLSGEQIRVQEQREQDVLTLDFPVNFEQAAHPLQAIRLNTLPTEELPGAGAGFGGGNFVITRVLGAIKPQGSDRAQGRYVRIEMPGVKQFLSLAEVQVLSGGANIALQGTASQISTDYNGPAQLAIDGNTSGVFTDKSTTHTANDDSPWWEVDLKAMQPVDLIHVWNRTDGVGSRLANFKISLLNEARETVWEQVVTTAPMPDVELSLSGVRQIVFAKALADYEQPGFAANNVLDAKNPNDSGWAVGGETTLPHQLTLIPSAPLSLSQGDTLTLTIEMLSKHTSHTLGQFSVALSVDPRAIEHARLPSDIAAIARRSAMERSPEQQSILASHFLKQQATSLTPTRERLEIVRKSLADQKPMTTVPIYRELSAQQRRQTFIQLRGDFLAKGDEVTPGLPEAFHPLPEGAAFDRLGLARWLVDEQNPLTARVIANRYWEAIFGRGLVATSEEFGSQGELPSHPQLLDWLAVELQASGWNTKAFLKQIVMSATYRQSSAVTAEQFERDPDNMLLARGPRVRLTAEMIRDQALAISGLLSAKMYGPPVNPAQPNMGLNAAFGGATDWKTSSGEDQYRRGLYTNWRRSNPYPSMSTFDAPNREVCTVRRTRTNTPLQALVTLNDPVYVEAAQALARKMLTNGQSPTEIATLGIEETLGRPARPAEVAELTRLYEAAFDHFQTDSAAAEKLATVPLGPLPEGVAVQQAAAWTTVANVLLNLDELFMKR